MMNDLRKIRIEGMSYREVPVQIREKFAVSSGEQKKLLKALNRSGDIEEGVVLSTCNRVEIYSISDPDLETCFLANCIDEPSVHSVVSDEDIYRMRGKEAIRHLFRVVSGLDSMILGETQILQQARTGYRNAQKANGVGKSLHTLFQAAFSTASRVHENTNIDRGISSVPEAAVSFVRRIFETPEKRSVTLLGAGEVARVCVKHLQAEGIAQLTVCNRTLETAQNVAGYSGGSARTLDELPELLEQTDILICATRSPEPLVTEQMLRESLRERRNQPLCIVDLSVPGDLESGCGDLDHIYLFTVDDLQEIADRNLEHQFEEVDRAELIVDEEVDSFAREARARQLDPLIREFRTRLVKIADKEKERCFQRMNGLEEGKRSEIDELVRRIVNKVAHPPITRLKQEAKLGNGEELVRAMNQLFLDRNRLPENNGSI